MNRIVVSTMKIRSVGPIEKTGICGYQILKLINKRRATETEETKDLDIS